jgi:NAD(P)-dependent dehydrogenase (short-subunit alcohol dehydrogenase family)
MNQPLRNQVALVTGGGRGLGQTIALALSRAGADVAIIARSIEELERTKAMIEQTGPRTLAVAADVTDRGALEHAFGRITAELGPVDILVNNAGVSGPLGPIWENDLAEWWHCMEVNVKGAMLCTGAILPAMIERGSGRIVNVSSAAATSASAHQSAYITSKTALTRLTQAIAAEARNHGVPVFAICPGTARTQMTEGMMKSKWMKGLRKIFDDGRDVSPQRAAELVVWLATGQGDSLSGLCIDYHDNLRRMLSHERAIRRLGLHVLQVRAYGPRMAAVYPVVKALDFLRRHL